MAKADVHARYLSDIIVCYVVCSQSCMSF